MRLSTATAALVSFAMLAAAAGVIHSGALTQALTRLAGAAGYTVEAPAPPAASATDPPAHPRARNLRAGD